MTNQFLVFIALLELLVPGLDGVATDHLSLLCCHFSLFLKDFLGKQTDKHTERNDSGCLLLLPINKQTKLSNPRKYGMDLSFVQIYEVAIEDEDHSRFSCKPRKGRSPAVKLLLWDVYKRKGLKLIMAYLYLHNFFTLIDAYLGHNFLVSKTL